MADNVTLNSGSGGATLAADDIAGTHHQRVKIQEGADGSATDVSDSNPLPVELSDGTDTVLVSAAGSAQVDISAALPAGTNAIGKLAANSGVDIGDVDVTSIVPGTGATNLGKAEDAAHTTADVGVMALAVRRAADTPTSGADGDYEPLKTDANGHLKVEIFDGGNSHTIDTAGGAIDVSGATVTVDMGANNDVQGAVAEGAAVANNPFLIAGDDGTNVKHVAVAADGAIHVDDGGNTLTVDGTVSVDLNAGTNTNEVVGDVAHDATAAGNPVAIAARATNSVEGLTQVAATDATYVSADLNGVLITRPHTTLEEIISERVSDTGGTSTAFTNFAAGGAGIHNYVTTITIWNSSATDGYVDFRDGTGGSVIFTAPAPATGGSVINLPVPLKGAANTALAYDVSGALSTVYISVIGFQAQG